MIRLQTRWVVAAARVAVAATVLAVAACSRRPPRPAERLVLADLRQPATSLTFVAQAMGCFRREGLVVEERTFDAGRDAIVLLAKGEADVAIAFETPTVRQYLEDGRVRALATLHTSTRNSRVIARRDRGIATVGDLRGKRIGASLGTNTEFLVSTLLTFGGIAPSDVTVVDVPPAAGPGELAAGRLDAVALWDPHAGRAAAVLGEDAVVLQTDLYTEFSLVATRADVVASRRPALLALLRGLACAERATQERPREAFEAVRAKLPERSEAEIRAALARVSRGISLDDVLLTVLRREGEWLRAAAPAGAPARDPARLVDPTLLDEVLPEAVNLPASR